jgi:outer membrane lipoprotein SlyB
MKTFVVVIAATAAAALASGCAVRYEPAPPAYAQAGYPGSPGPRHGARYGVVQSIDAIRAQSQTSGGGALLGAAIGGLAGHQIDHGATKAAATAVGIVAGALLGNEIEKNNAGARDIYRVTVRDERGGLRSFDYVQLSDLRVGDRVRIDGNQLYR